MPDFNDKYVYTKKEWHKSENFNRLMKQYVSEVSPDRKGIITSGLKAVAKNRQDVLKPIDFIATLLEGEVKYQKHGKCKKRSATYKWRSYGCGLFIERF